MLWSRLPTRASDEGSLPIFAPALAALADGSLLVMATLPVLDWNGLLLEALERAEPTGRQPESAAVLMIDPFACWQEMADALRSRGFGRVANFPPASFCHGAAGSPDAFDAAEKERLAWFEGEGFGTVRIAVREDAGKRITSPGQAGNGNVVIVPAEVLSYPIANGMALPICGS